MSDVRTASAVLLIAGIIISAVSFGYYLVNIEPMYDYLDEAIDWLERAQIEESLDRQLYAVNESIKIYESGISKQHLEALRTLSVVDNKENMNYWLPKISSQLTGERDGARFPLRGLATAGLLLCFMATNVWGTIEDYDSWSTNERHAYTAIDFALLLGLIVVFIP